MARKILLKQNGLTGEGPAKIKIYYKTIAWG